MAKAAKAKKAAVTTRTRPTTKPKQAPAAREAHGRQSRTRTGTAPTSSDLCDNITATGTECSIIQVDRTGETQDVGNLARLEKDVEEMRLALEKERTENADLQRRLDQMADKENEGGRNPPANTISRPGGAAGTNFSIQEAMGLAGSAKKYETYKAIQRNLRDLALNARINWEVPWAQVAARDKAKLFEVARDQHPFLRRFERDWATEEIVKQFIKNKRKHHYAKGWLEVPEKYNYLKNNSMIRNPTASRSKKAMRGSLGGREMGAAVPQDEVGTQGTSSGA